MITFTSREARNDLSRRLVELSNYMRRSCDQGNDHRITVCHEMMEDLIVAAAVVGCAPIKETQ